MNRLLIRAASRPPFFILHIFYDSPTHLAFYKLKLSIAIINYGFYRNFYKTIEELEEVSKVLLKFAKNSKKNFIFLNGDLGAGKTTLTQFIAKALKVDGSVNSPTYVLKNEYETNDSFFKKLIHIDAYRLSASDMEVLELDEINNNELCIIEWAENIDLNRFVDTSILVQIDTNGEDRIFKIKI